MGESAVIATNRSRRRSEWFFRAARGLASALTMATLCFASGAKADALSAGTRAFVRHDYVRAASLLLAEAERGSPAAQTYLGYMYQYGLGVPQDYVVATSWLHQAAEQGEPTGQFLLGLLFDKGFGVPQDWVEAEIWLSLAVAHAEAKQQEYYARVRDAIAQKLTLNQLAEAQRRASAWTPIASRIPAPRVIMSTLNIRLVRCNNSYTAAAKSAACDSTISLPDVRPMSVLGLPHGTAPPRKSSSKSLKVACSKASGELRAKKADWKDVRPRGRCRVKQNLTAPLLGAVPCRGLKSVSIMFARIAPG
jgi:uncharacterized protein